jgi:hypothetical protein
VKATIKLLHNTQSLDFLAPTVTRIPPPAIEAQKHKEIHGYEEEKAAHPCRRYASPLCTVPYPGCSVSQPTQPLPSSHACFVPSHLYPLITRFLGLPSLHTHENRSPWCFPILLGLATHRMVNRIHSPGPNCWPDSQVPRRTRIPEFAVSMLIIADCPDCRSTRTAEIAPLTCTRACVGTCVHPGWNRACAVHMCTKTNTSLVS